MSEYSNNLNRGNEGRLKWVVPYLLRKFFENKPTSNKTLSEAFWKLMGKDVMLGGVLRWRSGKRGVPYQINKLVKNFILKEISPQEYYSDLEYPEYVYWYVLGEQGEKEINDFLKHFKKEEIDKEINTYLRKSSQELNQDPENA